LQKRQSRAAASFFSAATLEIPRPPTDSGWTGRLLNVESRPDSRTGAPFRAQRNSNPQEEHNMFAKQSQFVASAVFWLVVAAPLAPAWANLLVDPGFESNPLTSYVNVLNDFTTYQGIWGAEVGTITGVDNGVTPAQAAQMLRMDSDGLITTQGFQVTDVSSYAGAIDAGAAIASLSALFNTDMHVPAAQAAVYLQFFSAANYGSQIGTGVSGPLALDSSDTTWETAQVATPVPVGTRWVLSQVYYANASLIGNDGTIHPGYVDAADLRLIPEPAALGLLAVGSLLLRRRST
jgi:hypothetical protein